VTLNITDKEKILDKLDACVSTLVWKETVSSDKTKKRLRYLLFKFNCDGEVASRK
jgi:hypothetical protein